MASVEESGMAGLKIADPEVDDGKEKRAVKRMGSALDSRLLTNSSGLSNGKSQDKKK